ncbi:zinc finger BED domain-containing protein 5-like [Palaemon carinicauda]|uniref:zinc finger BED domain-containing protein 5-like n=1 Tax=Palaemon carinicauda TaxID=392227 RepID=UPI0035B57836
MKNNPAPAMQDDLKKTNGVYQYKCPVQECPGTYIGMTTMRLSKRSSCHVQEGTIKMHCLQNHNFKTTREHIVKNVTIIVRAPDSRRFDMPKRIYDPPYIKYGFIAIEHGGEALLQCVVCMKSLSNAAMTPSLLKRHLETNQADKKDRDQSYFQRLGENVKRQSMDKTGQIYQKGAGIVKASYEVALLVAKNMKAHTIAESLIMPAAKILVSQVIGEEAVAKLESVSVSNNTVQRRIKEMSVDIADQVFEGVKSSKYGFASQLNESTDVTNCSELLVYVRFMQSNAAKTELLLSQDLSSTTTGKDIFNVLDNFFKQNELVGFTTDGAPSMLSRKSGFQAHVKAVAPKATAVHCFIHRFALCAKVLPPKLLSCLNRVIRIVNFV